MLKNILLLSSLVLGLLACDSQKDLPQQTASLSNPQLILDEFNQGKFGSQQGELLSGSVDLLLIEDSVLLVHLSAPSLEEDLVYGLFFNDEPFTLEPTTWSNAQVLFLKDQLIVTNLKNGEDFWLKLTNSPDPHLLKTEEIDGSYEGYGLSRTPISRNLSGQTWAQLVESGAICSCQTAANLSSCDSGGEGAISCGTGNQISTCEVVCSGKGYVACCENALEK